MLQNGKMEKRTKICELMQEMLIKTKPTVKTAVTFLTLKM